MNGQGTTDDVVRQERLARLKTERLLDPTP